MLSSGTLNLKFMKRNLVTTTNPITDEKVEHSINSERSDSYNLVDRKGKQKEIQTKVVYEDSLMSFPVLHPFGSFSSSKETSMSTFAGRRSFGNFNSAVEQLGQPIIKPSTSLAAAQQSSQPSRPQDTQQSSSTKVKRKPVNPSQDKPARSQPKPPIASQAKVTNEKPTKEIPKTSGFQKPFQSTQIKSNPKKRSTSETQSTSDLTSTSQSSKKRKSQTPSTSQKGKPKLSKELQSGSSSEESETVHREIEPHKLHQSSCKAREDLLQNFTQKRSEEIE
ncbi:uncharacterized protein MELLADRAFT_62462 [Melampsora larici-populina 98AG31]|uniref:Uncharacterized protein n=1 Tax=Melampsora larici-populina (strain 98AG31 / pathotype 3-4-7) TaxID=747676 RepID=F4RJ21_MELLP|nr:uncharacterized protein MELLADRAFT_62462 [Melampsora larici-populina 98AG31]EGG07729.1 hypothetical protein MELLADRAFT_62462 [Melampsora larici-populina 98AG31]